MTVSQEDAILVLQLLVSVNILQKLGVDVSLGPELELAEAVWFTHLTLVKYLHINYAY